MASGKKKVTFRWGNLLSLNPEYPHQGQLNSIQFNSIQ